MTRYVTIQKEIEAIQVTETNYEEVRKWLSTYALGRFRMERSGNTFLFYILTSELQLAPVGSYLVSMNATVEVVSENDFKSQYQAVKPVPQLYVVTKQQPRLFEDFLNGLGKVHVSKMPIKQYMRRESK